MRVTDVIIVVLIGIVAIRAQRSVYDIVLEGGRAIDPETGLDGVRNVAIVGSTIARITDEPLNGQRTIDARRLVVAPGFIELFQHGHDEESYRLKALDGVTTALDLEVLEGGILDTQSYTGRALLHYGTSAGTGAARQAVLDSALAPGVRSDLRPSRTHGATPEQVARIRTALTAALDAGAVGLGMTIWPGMTRSEVIEMFRLAAERQSPLFVRPRSRGRLEPGSTIEAITEIIGASAITGASAHIVHLHWFGLSDTRDSLALMDGARLRGLDITADANPYRCNTLDITGDLFKPGWRERLGIDYSDVRLQDGTTFTAEIYERLRTSRTPQRALVCLMPQELVDLAMLHPQVMVSSHAVKGGPQNAGTYARTFAQYVRSQRKMTLADAVRKMSLMPALRIERTASAARRKGRLQEGADADLVLFDPEAFADRATHEAPEQASTGVKHLLVAGTLLVDGGKIVPNVWPGQAIVSRATAEGRPPGLR